MGNLDFGEALKVLKAGGAVARHGWNGKSMFLLLVPGDSYGLSADLREKIVPEDRTPDLLPWIGMRTATGAFVPWLASQSDVLGEDWVEIRAAD